LISQDPCILTNTKALPGKDEWKQELDIRCISKIICLMVLCLKLSTGPFRTCGYADSSSVAKLMSQP
jgi:hypothetical protein